MTRCIRALGITVLIVAGLALASAPADAGRTGGPSTATGTAPAGMSVYYDMSFGVGPAVLNLAGSGTSQLYLIVYDTDGHTIIGSGTPGTFDRRTLVMNVYRGGTFRVEVRNLGLYDNNFTLTTN